jgi:DNA repair and recombination protein RAD52
MFTPDQVMELSAPLSRENVKKREQSGRKVSYVEGWHVIAEANRIFGFGNWTRETTEIRCVAEREREIGSRKDPGFGVTYIAKVRVSVWQSEETGAIVTREGCGAGHGIDRDLGQAHESAIKEAETDAMKRALMTFGNPFGLALYDKEQANVSDESGSKVANADMDSRAEADDLIAQVRACRTEEDIRAVGKQTRPIYDKLPSSEQVRVVKAGQDRIAFLAAQKDRAA